MNRYLALTALALPLTLVALPASAVVYCKAVGVPKGCVVAPVRVAPVVVAPVAPAARAIAAPKPGNWNGGVNRLGVRR
ncbi:hypothetical protein [Thiobaca trueperi]|uniref:PXPV repeat-containing protein n=1 Tax=Thiobaca trueperi TaxID=127458 RepID=A0A4R3N6K0_9GAMM|nr:hypothetical protein [Thiobaca trueperi]TCT24107.1 hypothetical protein EDC35_101427 [Thiobaca trueperi]